MNIPPILISSGSLDTSVGGDGLTSTTIGAAADQARGIVIQSDGRYVVAGWSDMGGGNNDFAVVRFNGDGSFDPSFSGDGKQTAEFAGVDNARAVALQSDGRIVLAGTTTSGIDTNIALARYNTDGSLDTTFDGDGKLTFAFGTGSSSFQLNDGANALAIQSDGKIVVAGSSYFHYLLLRYNQNGTLDTSFGGNGRSLGEFNSTTSQFNAIAFQGNGKIIAAGYVYTGSYDLGVARYDPNGNIDTSFNSTGDKVFSLGAYEHLNAVAVQADGKILLAGDTGSGFSNTDAVLIRLNVDGSFDTSFGGDSGIVTLNVSNVDTFNSLVVQADGRILAAGSVSTGFGEALIVRFNANGSLDTSFGTNGVFSTIFDRGTLSIYDLSIAPNGLVVAVGDSFTGTADFGMLRLAGGTVDQFAISGSAFNYTLPATAFFDANDDPLTYSATLANGAALPSWLSFNTARHTFSGTPADGDFCTRKVQVTASDGTASVSTTFPLEVSTVFIEALRNTNHSRWNDTALTGTPGTSITFSFMNNAPVYASANEASTFLPMGATQEQAVRDVLQLYHEISGISFTEVADAGMGGQLRFGTYLLTDTSVAYGNAPSSLEVGGDVWVNRNGVGYDTPVSGNSAFTTLLHEVGHALGLKHPGPYGSSDTAPFLSTSVDNAQYTVMSYNDRADTLFRDVTGTTVNDIHYTSVAESTQMLYDIAAIQFFYGANTATRSGNDTYTFDPSIPFFKTLWDGGGIDIISVSNFTEPCVIDLRDGHFSSIRIVSDPLPPDFIGGTSPTYLGANNLAIAYDVTIENATGGSGNDILTGNDIGNILDGAGGNDTLIGGIGRDTLIGGAGNDVLKGGVRNDVLIGGPSKDRLSGGSGADHFVYTAATNTGLGTAGRDIITDFSHAQGDRLDLHFLDANSTLIGIQAWIFVSGGFTGATGQVTFDSVNHLVQFDLNGDRQTDFEIALTGVSTWVKTDFMLP